MRTATPKRKAWTKFSTRTLLTQQPLAPGCYFELTRRQNDAFRISFGDADGGNISCVLDGATLRMTVNGKLYMLPFITTSSTTVGFGMDGDGFVYLRSSLHAGAGQWPLFHQRHLGGRAYLRIIAEHANLNFGKKPFVLVPPSETAAAAAAAASPQRATINDLPIDVLGSILTMVVESSVDRAQALPDFQPVPILNSHLTLLPGMLSRVSTRFHAAVQADLQSMWRAISRGVFTIATQRAPIADWTAYYRRRMDVWRAKSRNDVIANCTMEFQCPLTLDALSYTADAGVRHCEVCNEHVYAVNSVEQALAHIDQNHCVAYEQRDPLHRHIMGKMRRG